MPTFNCNINTNQILKISFILHFKNMYELFKIILIFLKFKKKIKTSYSNIILI